MLSRGDKICCARHIQPLALSGELRAAQQRPQLSQQPQRSSKTESREMTEIDGNDSQHNTATTNPWVSTGDTASEGVAGYDVGNHEGPKDSGEPTTMPAPVTATSDREEHTESANPFADSSVHDEHAQAEGTPDLPARPAEPHEQTAEHIPPEIEGLKAMFPDFDVAILFVICFYFFLCCKLIDRI